MRTDPEDEERFEVPMTPLIDVVFLLLIFFLVATNFTRKEIDHKINLPRVGGGERPAQIPENLVINIRADGTIVVDKRVVEADELRLIVQRWQQRKPGKPVNIRADKNVIYAKVMGVLALCKRMKVDTVHLPVEELEKQGAEP